MASPTRWTWVWLKSSTCYWNGRPGVLQSMGSQRVRHDWSTELKWSEPLPVPGLVFDDCIDSFSIFGCKECNQSGFSIVHLVMSTCRVVSCVIEKELTISISSNDKASWKWFCTLMNHLALNLMSKVRNSFMNIIDNIEESLISIFVSKTVLPVVLLRDLISTSERCY